MDAQRRIAPPLVRLVLGWWSPAKEGHPSRLLGWVLRDRLRGAADEVEERLVVDLVTGDV